jgi:rubrerythrin
VKLDLPAVFVGHMSLDDRLAIAEDIISPHQMHGRLAIEAIREARARLKANLTPVFMCGSCGVFSGDGKERQTHCRYCGAPR